MPLPTSATLTLSNGTDPIEPDITTTARTVTLPTRQPHLTPFSFTVLFVVIPFSRLLLVTNIINELAIGVRVRCYDKLLIHVRIAAIVDRVPNVTRNRHILATLLGGHQDSRNTGRYYNGRRSNGCTRREVNKFKLISCQIYTNTNLNV